MRTPEGIRRAKPRDLLLQRYEQHKADDPPAPLSWLQYKNKLNLAAFRRKWAQR